MDHGTFVLTLFNARTSAHVAHLQTGSYAAHMALDAFYGGIVDLADRFAEVSIGCYGPLRFAAASFSLEKDPVKMLKGLKVSVADVRKGCKDEALLNILAETDELIASTLYKLERLS